MKKILSAGFILFFSITTNVYAKSKPIIIGPVYEIKEKDIIEVIKERAAKFDTIGYLKKQYNKAFYPGSLNIPHTERSNVRYIDPTTVLSSDITDAYGNIMYPAGYRFNVLDTLTLSPHLFIDGTNPEQIALIAKLRQKYSNLAVNLTAGDVMEIRKQTSMPVYFASRLMLDRFGVEKVPSFVVQEGSYLKVEEIDVRDEKAVK